MLTCQSGEAIFVQALEYSLIIVEWHTDKDEFYDFLTVERIRLDVNDMAELMNDSSSFDAQLAL